jgi:hypothetical protein
MAQVGPDPGVLTVGRMRADLGDEIEEIAAFGSLAVLQDLEPEGEDGILGDGQDKSEPLSALQGSDVDVLPGIIDLALQPRERGRD